MLGDDCDYWYQIGLVLTQLDGMVLGYNQHCDADKVNIFFSLSGLYLLNYKALSYDIFLYLNIAADYYDIQSAVGILNYVIWKSRRVESSEVM